MQLASVTDEREEEAEEADNAMEQEDEKEEQEEYYEEEYAPTDWQEQVIPKKKYRLRFKFGRLPRLVEVTE